MPMTTCQQWFDEQETRMLPHYWRTVEAMKLDLTGFGHYDGRNYLRVNPKAETMERAHHTWYCLIVRALLFLGGQLAHTSRYEMLISFIINTRTKTRTLRQMATRIETGYFDLKN